MATAYTLADLQTTPEPPTPPARPATLLATHRAAAEAVALYEQARALHTLSRIHPAKYKPHLAAVELELLAVVRAVASPLAMVYLLRRFTELTPPPR